MRRPAKKPARSTALRRGSSLVPALAAAVASALLAAACTSSSSGTPTPDAGALLTCSSDAECAVGFKCDRESRLCVCTGDAACPTSLFCNAFSGQCVPSVAGCTSDAVCKAGEYCDRALRSCKALTPVCGKCKTDDECGAANSKCAVNPNFPTAGTYCSPVCGTGGACSAGLVCAAAAKVCVPQQGACGVTNLCVPDTLAVCAKDSDCADSTQQCDLALKACVAKNRACPAGDACDPQQRVCVHTCAVDGDCKLIEGAAGYRCRNNACYQLATCNSDAECSATSKQICASNGDGGKSCAPGCVSPTDCPLGQGCNDEPSHPRCTPACKQNQDCPLNAVCHSGACASSFGGCAQACQTNAACALGSSCSANGCCVGGAAADFKALCPKGCTPANLATGCLAFAGADCSSGGQTVCDARYKNASSTACKPFGAGTYCVANVQLKLCSTDADCPYKGFRCSALGGPNVCWPYESSAVDACLATP
jgi:hypothetical protein